MKFHNISFSSKTKTTQKNRSIDYIKCGYLPDKKIPIVMKACFSEGKLMKLFGNPPLSEQFFHDPPLCPNFKNENLPPPPNFRRGRKLCDYHMMYCS